MLLNVIEVHPLHGVFESIVGNVPCPNGAVGEDKYRFFSALWARINRTESSAADKPTLEAVTTS
jgi:hypothetical protein